MAISPNEKFVVNQLRKVKFYHGVQTKEDTALIMKDAGVGDYLIRSTLMKKQVALCLFLSVKVNKADNDIHHYVIGYKGEEGICLHEQYNDTKETVMKKHATTFATYEELVHYYKQHRLLCGIRLSRALKRPKWQLRHDEVFYDEAGKLGAGNFCEVYRGKIGSAKKGESVKDVAIKVSKCKGKDDSAVIMETRNQLVAEAKIMASYDHINVTKLYGLACDMPPFMVCLEFCGGGNLESLLYKHGKEMEEFERQVVLLDAARGMRYLHAQKCLHRDLASRNCLIDFEGTVKIADFGLSKALSAGQTHVKEALKEAPLVWMAPECIQKESEFSTKSDVWAFGAVIYEVYFHGEKPFAMEKNDCVIAKSIRKARMPTLQDRTKDAKMQNLLKLIWTRKPEDRPDFQKTIELLVVGLDKCKEEDLKRFQINKLKNVTRMRLPNLSIEPEPVAPETQQNYEVSERTKRERKMKSSSSAVAKKGKTPQDKSDRKSVKSSNSKQNVVIPRGLLQSDSGRANVEAPQKPEEVAALLQRAFAQGK